ncbi:6-bladed beta-propeller [candidate division KSB1 bacterium]
MHTWLIVLFLFPSLFFYCSTETLDTYTVEMIDDVRHIHNHAPLWGDEPKVELEFVKKIGELNTTDEHYMFFDISDVVRDKDGCIYIVEARNNRVQKFDADGRYITSFGREGQGPGEYDRPISLGIDESMNIYVGDETNKVQIFDKDSNFKRMLKLQLMGRVDGYFIKLDGTVITSMLHTVLISGLGNFKVFDHVTGEQQKTLGEPVPGEDMLNYAILNIGGSAANNNKVVKSYTHLNRIDIHSLENDYEIRVDRPFDYKIENVAGEKYTSVSGQDIGFDYKNRLWVLDMIEKLTYQKDGTGNFEYTPDRAKNEFLIFSEEGILLGSVQPPENPGVYSFPFRVQHDRIYLIRQRKYTNTKLLKSNRIDPSVYSKQQGAGGK